MCARDDHERGRGAPAGERRGERAQMVVRQIAARGIRDDRVLAALRSVPRHRFVPVAGAAAAYADEPLPIGWGQTISQPYIVALMTELLACRADDRVLEIGTGCGYQTAVLARLVGRVFTIEIVPDLAARAAEAFAELGIGKVVQRSGDGRAGWPEQAPFDGILVAAAPERLEAAWADQLTEGGRMVVPLGGRAEQWLHRFTKRDGLLVDEPVLRVRFVPLVGTT